MTWEKWRALCLAALSFDLLESVGCASGKETVQTPVVQSQPDRAEAPRAVKPPLPDVRRFLYRIVPSPSDSPLWPRFRSPMPNAIPPPQPGDRMEPDGLVIGGTKYYIRYGRIDPRALAPVQVPWPLPCRPVPVPKKDGLEKQSPSQ